MKNNKDSEKKLFLPMIISVIITILIFLFSELFVPDYREIVNYIFLGLVYVCLYISLYFLFNNFYRGVLKKYFNILNKLSLINISGDINKVMVKIKNKSIYLYLIVTFCVVSFILFIWQLILDIEFVCVTNIICLATFLILLFLSIIMSMNIFKKKKAKKRIK